LKQISPLLGMCSQTQTIMSSNNIPSIYVPRVHNSVTWEQMKSVFEQVLGEGTVKRVEIVKIKPREGQKPPPFNRAYVHIKKWMPEFEGVRDKLVAGGTVKIEYDAPHYWLCLLNKSQQEKPKTKPRIILDVETDNKHTLADHMPDKFKAAAAPSNAAVDAMMRAGYKGKKDGVVWDDRDEEMWSEDGEAKEELTSES